MKTKHILFLQIAAFAMAACTSDLSEMKDELLFPDDALVARLPSFEEGTKVTFPGGLSDFKWSNGDCIAVGRSGAAANGTAVFTLLQGGNKVGNFINDAFSLNPSSEYYAYYPYSAGSTPTSFSMNVTGQEQIGTAGLSHIGKYNYMYSKFTTNENGGADFTFSNLCAILQVHFTADGEDDYTSMTIESDHVRFPTRASYNLVEKGATLDTSSEKVTLSFGDGMHVYNGENITLSMVAIPCDMSGSNLTFKINGKDGVRKEFTMAAYALTPGKIYHFREDDSRGNPPYGGCPDGHHPHMIDLGLPSGTLWACCDLGSSKPIEQGVNLAWGETDLVEKNTSNWENYAFMTDGYTGWQGISKYQIPDNKYEGIWYASDSTFIGDKINTLMMEDDAARVNWGGNWRIPTKAEIDELVNYTYKVSTRDYNGTGQIGEIYYKKKINGIYNNWDTHIFIPHGDTNSGSIYGGREYRRWSSSLNNTINPHALDVWVGGGAYWHSSDPSRVSKYPIRPVCSKTTSGGGGDDSGEGAGGGGGSAW